MKLTQLLVASLVASTVWANNSWVFFAKVKGILEPLSGIFSEGPFGNVTMFIYGDPSRNPVELTLQYNYAYTRQETGRQYAGIYEDELVFGSPVFPKTLDLDSKGKVESGPFYLCNLMGGSTYKILHRGPGKGSDYCEEVEIYILPYNRESKSAVLPTPDSAGEDAAHEMIKPCSFHHYGKNVRKEVFGLLKNYNGSCEIYINGKFVFRR